MKDKKCNCEYSPIIILPGINHSQTYVYNKDGSPKLDKNGNHIGGTFVIADTEAAKAQLPSFARKVLAMAATQHKMGIEEAAYSFVSAAAPYQKCDNDGNIIGNLKVKRFDTPISEFDEDEKGWVYRMVPMKCVTDIIGEDHIFFFTFNLVADPMTSADELDRYIQHVKEYTGHDKVTLLPVSLGGTILTAYLDAYGSKDLDRIVNAVACLDGTDIVADLFEGKFNTDPEYVHHTFLPEAMKELGGTATLGYTINSLAHLLPEEGFDALLRGFIHGAKDSFMLNSPQVWAMIPSYRYDAIAAKYLSSYDKSGLKKRTDRFQQARLNLKNNVLEAVRNGVKVDSIAGSNLDYGEVEYCFFGVVASASKFNSDGIINLSSTTMGATGKKHGEMFPENYRQFRSSEEHPDYSYISPDRKIDASTALLPDHTWIFLNQHHEVGRNDVVLNLCKSIIIGEVEDVHSDPVNHPQFNGACRTYEIRRWLLGEAERALVKVNSGEIKCAPSNKKELEDCIAEAKAILKLTVADGERVRKAEDRINAILIRLEQKAPPEEPKATEKAKEKVSKTVSQALFNTLGSGSVYDKFFRRKKGQWI